MGLKADLRLSRRRTCVAQVETREQDAGKVEIIQNAKVRDAREGLLRYPLLLFPSPPQ